MLHHRVCSGRVRPCRRRPLLLAIAAAVILLGIGLAGFMVYRISTDKGTVVIETDDPDVEVVVKQGGNQVTILDGKTNKQVELKCGAYEFELAKGTGGLRLVSDKLVLKRGNKEVVRIRREPVVAATPPVPALCQTTRCGPKAEEARRLNAKHSASEKQAEEARRLQPGDTTATNALLASTTKGPLAWISTEPI